MARSKFRMRAHEHPERNCGHEEHEKRSIVSAGHHLELRSTEKAYWLGAYDFTTDKGAAALNDYARTNDPFAKVGSRCFPPRDSGTSSRCGLAMRRPSRFRRALP
jgi:hypothetical protein